MDMATIPHKTEKGRAEVRTRAFHVGPRERSVLIMIDGKTSAGLLLAKLAFMKQAPEILQELCEGGFIDLAAPEASPALTSSPPPVTPLNEDLRARRQFARNFVLGVLGPAGHDLAVKLEACQTREVLLPLLEECRDAIEASAGQQRAQGFWTALGQMAITSTGVRRLAA